MADPNFSNSLISLPENGFIVSPAQRAFIPTDIGVEERRQAEEAIDQQLEFRRNYFEASNRNVEVSLLPVPGALVESWLTRSPSRAIAPMTPPDPTKRTVLHLGDSTMNHILVTTPDKAFRASMIRDSGSLWGDAIFGGLDATSLFDDPLLEHYQFTISGKFQFCFKNLS